MYDMSDSSLDRVATEFGGGVPKRSLVHFEGSSGTGKSVLSQRFIYGFLNNGFDVSYVSPQLDTPSMIQQMNSLSYDVVDHLVQSKKLNFKPVNVNTKSELFSTSGEERILLNILTSEVCSDIWESDVVVLDSLDMLIRNDPVFQRLENEGKGETAVRNFVEFLNKFIRRTSSTVIVTMNNDSINDKYLTPFRNDSDVYFRFSNTEVGDELLQLIEVERYQKSSEDISSKIMFRVQSGNGINIDKRSYA